jgi:ornithine carbamoyltransferase
MLTIKEAFEDLAGRRVAFIGVERQRRHSLLEAGALAGMDVTIGARRVRTGSERVASRTVVRRG